MPYVAPTSVSTGDVLTAARYNSDVVGNMADLRSYQNRFGSYRYTAGNVTLAGTSTWSTLSTIGTAADLTLNASDGDVIEAAPNFFVDNAAVELMFDVVTVVGTTVTNSFGRNTAAPAGWVNYNGGGWYCASGVFAQVTGPMCYTLQAGDISAGTVKLRLRYAMPSATNRTLYASSTSGFYWHVRNLGPVTT